MIVFQLEIFAFVLLLAYYMFWLIRDCIFYTACCSSMIWMDYIFQVATCEIDKKDVYTLNFDLEEDIPDRELQGVVVVFKQLHKKGVIVSLEEEGKEFVPCFNRDLLKNIMEQLMKNSANTISGYWEWDFFTRFLLKRKYENLYEQHERFEREHRRISAVGEGQYFCMLTEEK